MNWCVFRWRQRFSRSWSRCRSCSTKGKFTSCFKKSDLLPKSEGLHTPPKKHHKILNFLVLNWPCNSYTLSTAFFCPLSVSSISEDFLVWSRSWSFAPHISTWHSLELNLVKHNYFTVSVSVCVELWETHRHVTIRNMEPLCCCCMNRWVPKTLRTQNICRILCVRCVKAFRETTAQIFSDWRIYPVVFFLQAAVTVCGCKYQHSFTLSFIHMAPNHNSSLRLLQHN